MTKLITLALIAVLSFAVLAPATAEAGASTNAALALGAFAVLNQLVRGDTIFHPRPVYSQYGPSYVPQPSYPVYGPSYPYGYDYRQPDIVIMPPAVSPQPQVIWPSNCAPQYGTVYNDPYNPGLGRYVPTGLIECRWPNGQTALYYQDGRPVPVPAH